MHFGDALDSKILIVSATLIAYLSLVQFLRFRRSRSWSHKFPNRASFTRMTVEEAFDIQIALVQFEFPQIFGISIFFALFKTFGIPSISKVLVRNGQFKDDAASSKRAADTGVLLSEIAYNRPGSQRAVTAIARMNQLHAPYQKSGAISNDDLLYTLSLFALEPSRWVKKLEWRTLTELELCAMGTYWKSLGDAMGIVYEPLEGCAKWSNGREWLQAIENWSVNYEKRCMVPAASNNLLAKNTMNILLWNLPASWKPFGRQLALTLLEDRLRFAMILEEPSTAAVCLARTLTALRRLIIRHLCLPRFNWQRVSRVTERADPKTGRYFRVSHSAHPWYVRPTFRSRWSIRSLLKRMVGVPLPGDEGSRYRPQGYHVHEVGPRPSDASSLDVDEVRRAMSHPQRGGCPFSVG